MDKVTPRRALYETPAIEVVDLQPHTILAASEYFVYDVFLGDNGAAGTINGEYVDAGDF